MMWSCFLFRHGRARRIDAGSGGIVRQVHESDTKTGKEGLSVWE